MFGCEAGGAKAEWWPTHSARLWCRPAGLGPGVPSMEAGPGAAGGRRRGPGPDGPSPGVGPNVVRRTRAADRGWRQRHIVLGEQDSAGARTPGVVVALMAAQCGGTE